MSSVMTAADPSSASQRPEVSRAAFERLAEPLRRELKVHCYRMLGSVHEAEDLVQDTYLRAWRSIDTFDGSGSLRAWLYRIATNACLNALESRKLARRSLPDQLSSAAAAMPVGGPATEIAWLEPFPGSELAGIADAAPNPEARYSSREAVQLAFIAAVQELPPRQRAALLLCDVLGWAAADTAAYLGSSTAAVNSALQRSRETLARRYPDGRPPAAPRPDAAQQQLVDQYLRAWEGHDLEGFAQLLRQDATAVMPPWREWYAGREAIRSFFALAWKTCGGLRLEALSANGQPAFAVYERSEGEARWRAHSIHVLTFEHDAISTLTLFLEPRLFEVFGLPLTRSIEASS
jgi:RNA polymerase sigma-70 factor, ECF subfamily